MEELFCKCTTSNSLEYEGNYAIENVYLEHIREFDSLSGFDLLDQLRRECFDEDTFAW